MSPEALQRFVVRLLWDPALVERVYTGEPVPGLDAEGRALLTRVDRRAWDTDPYRRARTLRALVEEYPCTVAELGVAGLETFFGAPAFHDALQGRGSLATAFGAWIAPRAGPVVAIERAFVALRRAVPVTPAPGELVRGAVIPVAVPVGTYARWVDLVDALGADGLARALAGWRPPAAPVRGRGKEHLLVQALGGVEAVAEGSDGLHALLVAAARPVPRRDLRRVAVRLGASPAEADGLLDELVADGLLVTPPTSPAPRPRRPHAACA